MYIVTNISGKVQTNPKKLSHIASSEVPNNWAVGQTDLVDDEMINYYTGHTDVWTVGAQVLPGFPGVVAPMSYQNAVTAHAGGGQASATALTSEICRVTTVATAGDSVALPASAPGSLVVVINDAALPMQVFGAGTDTINDVATATGVSQMQQSVVMYVCTVAGSWQAIGLGAGYNGALMTDSAANALTAHAGGGQALGTPITTMLSRFTTVATAGDSALLPASAPGLMLTVINAAAANSMNVFPAGTDTINQGAASAAYNVPAQSVVVFYCTNAGVWHTIYYSPLLVQQKYGTNAATTATTLLATDVTGGTVEVTVNMTGTLGAGAALTLPTVASIAALIPNITANQTYKLRIINSSAGAFAWTVTTNTGWSALNGTMTIAQNTYRDFIVTFASATAASLQSIGGAAAIAV